MKMSDVFELPFDYIGVAFADQSGRHVQCGDFMFDQAAAEAINNHDRLTEDLELLKAKYATVCAELEYTSNELDELLNGAR